MDKDKQKPVQFWAKIEPLLIADILEKSGSILIQDLPLMLPHNPLKGKNPFGKTYAYTGQYEVRDGRYRPVGIGRMIFDEENMDIDLTRQRCTDAKHNSRIILPGPLKPEQERELEVRRLE